jgi:hypothetical protein
LILRLSSRESPQVTTILTSPPRCRHRGHVATGQASDTWVRGERWPADRPRTRPSRFGDAEAPGRARCHYHKAYSAICARPLTTNRLALNQRPDGRATEPPRPKGQRRHRHAPTLRHREQRCRSLQSGQSSRYSHRRPERRQSCDHPVAAGDPHASALIIDRDTMQAGATETEQA